MLARLWSSTLVGLHSVPVLIEIDVSTGLPGFHVVGLPDASVAESCDRVRTALRQSGFQMPPRRVTINLAPGDLRKHGPRFDLAIALGILGLAEILPLEKLEKSLVVGELGLDGQVRAVSGVLAATLQAKEQGLPRILVPQECAQEAAWVEGIEVVGISDLLQAIDCFNGRFQPPRLTAPDYETNCVNDRCLDLSSLVGQPQGRRALEIAAAGGHHLLLIGPPGCGKTHLARCLPGLLPGLDRSAAMEILQVRSALRGHETPQERQNLLQPKVTVPFQEPDMAATWAGLFGGDLPGEISRAHRGVLFLDELVEFRRNCLETLRTVLDSRKVEVVRHRRHLVYPADFLLVAAMNPCPCGYYGDRNHRCSCSIGRRQSYLAKLSGPIRDRIDLHLWISRPARQDWLEEGEAETSAQVRQRVVAAYQRQIPRGVPNCRLESHDLRIHCSLSNADRAFLLQSSTQLGLSGRSLHKVLRLARTIADLEGLSKIRRDHLVEAFSYRDPWERTLAVAS